MPPAVTSEAHPEVFHLRGELNAASAGGLRRDLSRAVGQRAVLLDMTEVEFVDAVGLGVILGTIRGIHEQGGVVAIVGAEPQRGFPGALRSAGIHDLVPLKDSMAVALAWLDETVRQ